MTAKEALRDMKELRRCLDAAIMLVESGSIVDDPLARPPEPFEMVVGDFGIARVRNFERASLSDDDLALMIRRHDLSFKRMDAVEKTGIKNLIRFTGNQWNEDFEWSEKVNSLSREDKLRVLEACKSV